MTKTSYADQLKHPKWQKRRLEMLEQAGWKCFGCGDKEKTLHVHHRSYIKGRSVWEYADKELQVLCEDCHEAEHSARDLLNDLLTIEIGLHPNAAFAAALYGGFLAAVAGAEVEPYIGRLLEGPNRPFAVGFLAGQLGIDRMFEAVEQILPSLTNDDSRRAIESFIKTFRSRN